MIYLKKTQTVEYSADQSKAVVIQSGSNRRIKVIDVSVSAEGTDIENSRIKLVFSSSRKPVFVHFTSVVPTVQTVSGISIKGKKGEPLHIISDLGSKKRFFVTVNYREE